MAGVGFARLAAATVPKDDGEDVGRDQQRGKLLGEVT
jgi:hypothetical protein